MQRETFETHSTLLYTVISSCDRFARHSLGDCLWRSPKEGRKLHNIYIYTLNWSGWLTSHYWFRSVLVTSEKDSKGLPSGWESANALHADGAAEADANAVKAILGRWWWCCCGGTSVGDDDDL